MKRQLEDEILSTAVFRLITNVQEDEQKETEEKKEEIQQTKVQTKTQPSFF